MNKSHADSRENIGHSAGKRHGLGKRLLQIWQDLGTDPDWKYEQLPPIELLEKLELYCYPIDSEELARAAWFWNRRPRLLRATNSLLWLTVILGLPFWLFSVPAIGGSLILTATVTVATDVVQFIRWRRQYESSLERLLRLPRTSAANDRSPAEG